MLFDNLVTGGVIEHNPALSVKAPRQKLGKGKTLMLTAAEMRAEGEHHHTNQGTVAQPHHRVGLDGAQQLARLLGCRHGTPLGNGGREFATVGKLGDVLLNRPQLKYLDQPVALYPSMCFAS
jgi:hypothetical protein